MSGTPVQVGKFTAKLGLKPLFEMFGEEWMVPVPVAFLVERGQQQLPLLN